MQYVHVIKAGEQLAERNYHLACGYYRTTSFFFEDYGFAVVIHCDGTFTFRSPEGEVLKTLKAKPMPGGRECYMDISITTEENRVRFSLPEYAWRDHYPNCDGESDRWSARITGVRDEIFYPGP